MAYERLLAINARHEKLLELIRAGDFSASDLAKELAVSEQTVYRDIDSLKGRGHQVRSVKTGPVWAYRLRAETKSA